MNFNNAKFIISAPNKNSWPNTPLKEICLLGKSNVGKSTFINNLVGNKKLAKISSTPGHTRLLNFYEIDNKFHIVDVPGYGFVKRQDNYSKNFDVMMNEYFDERDNTILYLLLIDSRHEPSKNDLIMYQYLLQKEKNFVVIGTKADKLNQSLKSKFNKYIKEFFNNEKCFLVGINNDNLYQNIRNYLKDIIN